MTTGPTLQLGFQLSDIITNMNSFLPIIGTIVAFAIALPVTFYVAYRLRGLVPGGRRR